MITQFETEDLFIQWNEEMAHKYDPDAYHLRSNFLIRWIERRRVKTILHFLKTNPNDVVLEVGCGAGNVLAQIPSNHLYGLDLSTYLLTKSQQRLTHPPARLSQTNAERLPFLDEQFDKLVCTEVLEHVANPRQVLGEMARVANKDAALVISIPNETWINQVKNLIRRLGLRRWLLQGTKGDSYNSPDHMTDEWHLHSFSLALLKEVSQNILVIDQVKAIPFWFIPLRFVTCCRIIPNESEVPSISPELSS